MPPHWSLLRQKLVPEPSLILKKVQVKLPPLPDVALKANQMLQDPDTEINKIAEVVEKDGALTTEILRFVNSTAMGVRNKVSTVKRAVSMLGRAGTRTLILTTAVNKAATSIKSPHIINRHYSLAGIERGAFAGIVAKRLGIDSDLSYAAALLQDFMLPTLTAEFTSEYAEALESLNKEGGELVKHEMQFLGTNHARLAAEQMLEWKFPDDLICCVWLHHEIGKVLTDLELSESSALPVMLSACLPGLIHQTPNGTQVLQKLGQKQSIYSLEDVSNELSEQMSECGLDLSGYQTLSSALEELMTTTAH